MNTTSAVMSVTSAISPKVIDNIAVGVGIMAGMTNATLGSTNSSSDSTAGQVVIGLGGNEGQVRATFVKTISLLGQLFAQVDVSRLYTTDPVGPPQPDFLNAAVRLIHHGPLTDLLNTLQQLEQRAHRRRTIRWGPRTLDLDILWAGDRVLMTSSLTVPHAQLIHRGFALLPLLDLVPSACDPIDGRPYSELISAEFRATTRLVSDSVWWKDPSAT